MPLDRYAKRFLDMMASAGLPDLAQVTPAEMRSSALELKRLVDAADLPMGQVEDGGLPGPDGPLRFRAYTPGLQGEERPPALIYFHGGGCVYGDLDTHESVCRILSADSGCRVISVDYRLAPEHRFPAAVDDAYAATRWVADNARTLGIDPARIAVGGDSAGGNLAAVVCQLARDMGTPNIALQLLFCPIVDLTANTPSRREFAEGYFLTERTIAWTTHHYCSDSDDLRDPRISPIYASDFSSLPPAHIHTAEFDPLRDEGKAYADLLERAGVDVQYTCHPGMIHHFYAMAGLIPQARIVLAAAGAALKASLPPTAAGSR